jgi:MFS family permease
MLRLASFEPLRERPFRLLWLGRTASSIGDSMVPVALAFAVLDIGGARDLGLVLASFTVGRLVFVLAGGVWSDRLERRLVMLSADLVRGVSQGTLAVLLLTDAARVWHFVILAGVSGAGAAFFVPASSGLVPQTVSSGRLQEANAFLSLSDSATHLAGPALSGLLVATTGTGVVFAIDAASYVVSAAFLWTLRVPFEARASRVGFLAEVAQGLRVIRERSWLIAAFLAFGIGNFSIATFFVLGPLVVREELGGASDWGLMMTGSAIGGLIGGVLALRIRPARPLLVSFPIVCLTSLQLLFLIEPFALPLQMFAAVLAVTSIVLANAIWDTVVQQHVPRDAISRVSSVDWAISLVLMPVGYTVAGPLAEAIGVDATLALAAAFGIVPHLAILLVPSVRTLRRLGPESTADASTTGTEAVGDTATMTP